MKFVIQSLLIILLVFSNRIMADDNVTTIQKRLQEIQSRLPDQFWKSDPIEIQDMLNKILANKKGDSFQLQKLAGLKHYTLEQEWDINTTSWQDHYQNFNTYDGNGNLLEGLYQTWNNAWVNQYKMAYTYNASGNPLTMQMDMWLGTSWATWIKHTYTYNAQGYSTSWFSQMLNMSTMMLEDYQRATHTFDANWYVIESLVEQWDSTATAWVNHELFVFTNDGNGNPTEELRKDWDGNAWVNAVKYTYTYNANDDMTQSTKEEWNGSAYDNVEKEIYTFDGNYNRTSYLFQTWGGSTWDNSEKDTWVYDGNNNMIEVLMEKWNGSAWENEDNGVLTYDGNNDCTVEIWQSWDGAAWVNSDKLMHQYTAVNAIGDENNLSPDDFTLSNYPNPFNPITNITFNLPEVSEISVKIYNIKGQHIKTLINGQKWTAGTKVIQWNGTDYNNYVVSSGIYFIHFQSEKYNQVKRCVFIK